MGIEHTTPDAARARPTIIERKQKPDGTIREYGCSLVHRSKTLAVIEFLMAQGGEIFGTPIEVPPGSISHGYFWTNRLYNVYRMRRADGSLIAHRFDAVTDVALSEDAVSYRDLILDWWVTADGVLIEEDRDELEQLQAEGHITQRDLELVNAAARQVFSRYRHIIDGIAELERKLGIEPIRG